MTLVTRLSVTTLAVTAPAVAALALAGTELTAQASPNIVVRLGDIVRIQGADSNIVTGIGLLVGLKGTGDSSKATREMSRNFMQEFGQNRTIADFATGNTTQVVVTAKIPPFSKTGQSLDVTVSAIHDTSSLFGGVLLSTKLMGLDRKNYAIAAGKVYAGGHSFGTSNATETRNHPTVGTIISGASLKIAPKSFNLNDSDQLELRLIKPSATSVVSAVEGINKLLGKDGYRAQIVDQYLLRINLPENRRTEADAVRLFDRVSNIPVRTAQRARISIDETTGTLIVGEGVQISPCTITVGEIHVSIISQDEVSQPGPGINRGETALVNRTRVEVATEIGKPQALKGGATVDELVKNLKAMQLTPHQLMEVFQHLHKNHYLHAELHFR